MTCVYVEDSKGSSVQVSVLSSATSVAKGTRSVYYTAVN